MKNLNNNMEEISNVESYEMLETSKDIFVHDFEEMEMGFENEVLDFDLLEETEIFLDY